MDGRTDRQTDRHIGRGEKRRGRERKEERWGGSRERRGEKGKVGEEDLTCASSFSL